jgi:hypothetical protein
MPFQKFIRRQAKPVFHADDVIRIKIHVCIFAASGKTCHTGMAIKLKCIACEDSASVAFLCAGYIFHNSEIPFPRLNIYLWIFIFSFH